MSYKNPKRPDKKQPEKWRETMDPFTLEFKDFKLLEVLGYPHAGNDVFYVKGIYKDEELYAFLKVARSKFANIGNEVDIINKIDLECVPEILEYGDDKYVLTREIEGIKLSTIVNDNSKKQSLGYVDMWGERLSEIHQIKGDFKDVKDRKFFHIPPLDYFRDNNIAFVYDYLITNAHPSTNKCFTHGDFHHANILWKDHKITGILDFEYAGIGIKEFDIAWAIIRRPHQKFMKTEEEIDKFLEGYSRNGTYDLESVRYYMVLIYSHFYTIGTDEDYKKYVYEFLKENAK